MIVLQLFRNIFKYYSIVILRTYVKIRYKIEDRSIISKLQW